MSDLKFATRISLAFFAIGTMLMAIYYFTMSSTVALIGYSYTGVAILTGMIYLILIGFRIISKKTEATLGFKCAAIVSLNLPIATLYFYFVMTLMTTARITFENATGRDISAVSIGGCSSQELGEFKTGESKTVWVKIKSDCSLVLFYKIDREPKLETPFEYLTHNNGMIATYRIGKP
ncbi:MAG TPA: hypothetical protein VK508_00470 [Cyclobacteriaceae bacterium]|nr:hypothetical protein [Cyclobacteriaceae bacterium]